MCDGTDADLLAEVELKQVLRGYGELGLQEAAARQFSSTDKHLALYRCRGCDLRWYSPAVGGNDGFYEALQQHAWYYEEDKTEFSFASKQVAAGARLLEVGWERGAFARLLPSTVHYRGLEYNKQAVDAARQLGLDVDICSIEAEVHHRGQAHDVVCRFQVLEHVAQPQTFLQSCAAALRPGGLLVVAVPSEDAVIDLAESVWLNMPPHHLARWSDLALGNALRSVGLQLVDTWHEAVSPVHTQWHRQVAVNAGLKKVFGRSPGLVADPGLSRLSRKLADVPVLGDWFMQRGLKAFPGAVRGHSVCMVAAKVASAS